MTDRGLNRVDSVVASRHGTPHYHVACPDQNSVKASECVALRVCTVGAGEPLTDIKLVTTCYPCTTSGK